MVISRHWIKTKKAIFLIPILVGIMLTGCVDENILLLHDGHKDSHTEYNEVHDINTPAADDYAFFGVWNIGVVAFTVEITEYPDWSWVLPRYGFNHDIRNFIGYEIEFRSDFVRLGEMIMHDPVYSFVENSTSPFSQLDQENNISLGTPGGNIMVPFTIAPGRFYNLADMLNYFDLSEAMKFVVIDYPDHEEIWFRGELRDPFDVNMIFNPLFQGFSVINYNYILLSGNGNYILANRIE